MSHRGDREAGDRAALLRRIGWEQTAFRVGRAAVGVFLVVGGVVSLAGTSGSRVDGLFPLALGLLMLWELRRGRSDNAVPDPMTSAQREVLETTLARHGRLAAVRQLREWSGASYRDATRDIDAAFPEHAATRSS